VPLETATYISDLAPANPAHTDGLSQADSHMRLIKAVLQATFPNINAAVTATPAVLNGLGANAQCPPGAILDFGMAAAPTGWLECDGQGISRTAYAALYAAIGTGWGPGDGSTTFNVPDVRSRYRRHRDITWLAGAVGNTQGPANLTHTHADGQEGRSPDEINDGER